MDKFENLSKIEGRIQKLQSEIKILCSAKQETRDDLNMLIKRANRLLSASQAGNPLDYLPPIEISAFNCFVDSSLSQINKKFKKFPELSASDIAVSSIAGIVAVAIDIFLVGTPEIVKIYKGGENFDGSILTKVIRKLGEGPLGDMCKKLETICKVPYDIAVVEDGMYPQNHRLRSLSHDPFFGLFFAIFDMIMNTTTFIDDAGFLRILPNKTYPSSVIKKLLCVLYYVGHIISDLFTARGIPVPGFFLTQFFSNGDTDDSIARIAEGMYLDGYDLRHFASMTTPVVVQKLIIDSYVKLTIPPKGELMMPLAQREKNKLDDVLLHEKMNFIASSIAVSGNAVKFFAPPYSCNPSSINVPEWLSFIKSGIIMIEAQTRDSSAEEAICNRQKINDNWEKLEQEDHNDMD